MSIASVASLPTAASSSTSVTENFATTNAAQTQDSFIQLLVAQIRNQDPTKPMTSSDMTAQMSSLNMVSGINQLNTTLTSLAGNAQSTNAMQSASLIGHSVLVPGNNLQLTSGKAEMGLQLGQAAADVQVNILDSSGKVINTQDLGAQGAGLLNLTWDGTGATESNSPYTFTVTATNAGTSIPSTNISPLEVAVVKNVTLAGGITSLNVTSAGNVASKVALSEIYQVNN
ncbi:MAG: flagellar hook capping FlgD N-terminal domain-containing protein [Methylococcaceae bacterium]|jgi:flagellar basal-body rod modification protein FlgD